MSIVARAKNMILSPAAEWPAIEGESSTVGALLVGYALPLMLIRPAVIALTGLLFGGLVGGLAGSAGIGLGFGTAFGIGAAISAFVGEAVAVVVLALLTDALAPTFGGVRNSTQAFKLVVYAATASWVSGIALIVPGLGALVALAGAIYSFYTFYLGLSVMMKCPAEKRLPYVLVIVVVGIVVSAVISGVSSHLF